MKRFVFPMIDLISVAVIKIIRKLYALNLQMKLNNTT